MARLGSFCITITLITCVFCSLVNDWQILRIGWTIFLHFCVDGPFVFMYNGKVLNSFFSVVLPASLKTPDERCPALNFLAVSLGRVSKSEFFRANWKVGLVFYISTHFWTSRQFSFHQGLFFLRVCLFFNEDGNFLTHLLFTPFISDDVSRSRNWPHVPRR